MKKLLKKINKKFGLIPQRHDLIKTSIFRIGQEEKLNYHIAKLK